MQIALIQVLALFSFIAALWPIEVNANTSVPSEQHERFAVYYSDKLPPEQFADYKLLVFDSRYYPPLGLLKEKGSTVLGYISLGEAESSYRYFPQLKKSGLLLKENPNWKGSYIIDVRSPVWGKLLVEDIIPDVLSKGFDGIFLDTLDSPIEMERVNRHQYKGMNDGIVHLIQMIRMHYPSMTIMVNRGYPVLPRISRHIDMVLGESMLSDYDFSKKQYKEVEKPLYLQQVAWLQDVKRINPSLKIYTLDYADPKDRKTISNIYRQQRENDFIPYVATVELDSLIKEN